MPLRATEVCAGAIVGARLTAATCADAGIVPTDNARKSAALWMRRSIIRWRVTYKSGMRGTSPRTTAEMLPRLPVIIHIGPHIGGRGHAVRHIEEPGHCRNIPDIPVGESDAP